MTPDDRDPIAVIVGLLFGRRACIDCASGCCAGIWPAPARRAAA